MWSLWDGVEPFSAGQHSLPLLKQLCSGDIWFDLKVLLSENRQLISGAETWWCEQYQNITGLMLLCLEIQRNPLNHSSE